MSNPAYYPIAYAISYIAETAPGPGYEAGRATHPWTEEEIASIRHVLQKLTAARVLNLNDAEDLVQETLLTLIAKGPQPDLKKGPLVWSLGILRNKVGNYYRKAQRGASLGAHTAVPEEPLAPPHAAPSPEVGLFHEELQRIIQGTLAQFPAPQRRAMELLIAGFEPGEIVSRLSPERYQNVINRLHRGRKILARELAKYGYGPGMKSGMQKMKRCGLKK